MNVVKNISVLGDSILRGVIFDEVSGKYKFLKESAVNLFSKANEINMTNHSKFGCTTRQAIKRLPAMLSSKNVSNSVLLELGGNDCDFNWDAVAADPKENHRPKVSYADFKTALNEIIEHIIEAGKRPVIMTLPPIDSDKYFSWISKNCKERAEKIMDFLGDKNLIYRHQELYSYALERAARKYNLYTVNVREAFLSIHKLSDYLCIDGIHPNELGQKLIRQVFDNTYNEYVASL